MILNPSIIPVGVAFVLRNLQSQTVLDLSGTNHVSITGWPANGGDNQQWIFESADDLYTIKNVRYGAEYVGYNTPNPGQSVSGVDSPIDWVISAVGQGTYRFAVPDTDLVLSLADSGNPESGNPAVLARNTGAPSQKWQLVATQPQ